MSDIVFKRTGLTNPNGSIPGELTIGNRTWPTVERGASHTFVRQGEYTLKMDLKHTGRAVQCLRFDHEGIRTHLIHDAFHDRHTSLEGCIAPGKDKGPKGIKDSAAAMNDIFLALGGFKMGAKTTIKVENNIVGDEDAEHWIARRKLAGRY